MVIAFDLFGKEKNITINKNIIILKLDLFTTPNSPNLYPFYNIK